MAVVLGHISVMYNIMGFILRTEHSKQVRARTTERGGKKESEEKVRGTKKEKEREGRSQRRE